MSSNATLLRGFLEAAARHPERPALELGDQARTYAELAAAAGSYAATLERHGSPAPPVTAVLGRRTPTLFAAVLAALGRGHAFAPLNPSFPAERTAKMLARSTARALIVDEIGRAELAKVLPSLPPEAAGLTVLLPDSEDVSELATAYPQHHFLGRRDLVPDAPLRDPGAAPDDAAYLLFTSGSTGEPKGVAVLHRNVSHFLGVMIERYSITEEDRFSQTFDLTFDLSVFDMFMAWWTGACLCVPTQEEKLLPGKYIVAKRISVWFSVPSTAVLMNRLRLLRPGAYPGLRWSLFCGEALPVEVTRAWAAAAPASTVENLYGPTELTIACTYYRWDEATSPAESHQGVVPIGEPYPGMRVLVVDDALTEVPPGEVGELLMTGPQLTPGYWNDPARTAAAFVTPPGSTEVHYRTGDLVRRPTRPSEPLVYLGRVDHQIKIQGYRVELGEVECALREAAGVDVAIAIGWPPTASGADSIVGFVAGSTVASEEIVGRLRSSLPSYMQVSRVVAVPEFPLNANGKVDRGALRALLERGS